MNATEQPTVELLPLYKEDTSHLIYEYNFLYNNQTAAAIKDNGLDDIHL